MSPSEKLDSHIVRVFGMCEETEELRGKPGNLHRACKPNSRKGPPRWESNPQPLACAAIKGNNSQHSLIVLRADVFVLFFLRCFGALVLSKETRGCARYPSPTPWDRPEVKGQA